jgi:hypothetical protein
VLRLLRDSSRLIKLSYLEFDLDRILTEGRFADFALLYRLLHASPLPRIGRRCRRREPHRALPPGLARLRQARASAMALSRQRGARHPPLPMASSKHPDNEALREALQAGKR